MEDSIRTRMAPSPTGWLHVGTARTALFNFLFARHHGGVFILRIEDTDRERSRKEFEDDIIEQLSWLGLGWDEFYRQSERLSVHTAHLKNLLETGKAFYCAHTKEELEDEHKKQMEDKSVPRHICSHRDEGRPSQLRGREEGIIRLRNDAKDTLSFTDSIRGEITTDPQLLGDFSIARELASPLYNFVVVVDDFEMKITHVIRGEDHISNTPKQILIQQALGFSSPAYAHLPLLLGEDRSKLSKRHGDTTLRDYREQGYLPEALVNFLGLLGWNPGTEQEFFTLDELVKEFTLEKVQKAGAIFNEEKLAWINRSYIRNLSTEEFAANLISFIKKSTCPATAGAGKNFPADLLNRIAYIEKQRLSKFSDIREHILIYTEELAYERELLRWKKEDYEEVKTHLTNVRKILCDIDEGVFLSIDNITELLMPYASANSKGNVLWPLRVALSGREASPSPFEIMYVIGKEETIKRIDNALQLCNEESLGT